jgi:hypothetical protein
VFTYDFILSRRGAEAQRGGKEMDEKFEVLDSENGDIVIVIQNNNYRLSQMISASSTLLIKDNQKSLDSELREQNCNPLPSVKNLNNWIYTGVDCEILKPGKNWQKGKCRIKVNIEFCPNETEVEETQETKESESPLDDLRRQINDISS